MTHFFSLLLKGSIFAFSIFVLISNDLLAKSYTAGNQCHGNQCQVNISKIYERSIVNNEGTSLDLCRYELSLDDTDIESFLKEKGIITPQGQEKIKAVSYESCDAVQGSLQFMARQNSPLEDDYDFAIFSIEVNQDGMNSVIKVKRLLNSRTLAEVNVSAGICF